MNRSVTCRPNKGVLRAPLLTDHFGGSSRRKKNLPDNDDFFSRICTAYWINSHSMGTFFCFLTSVYFQFVVAARWKKSQEKKSLIVKWV